jgi:hypothetical protein
LTSIGESNELTESYLVGNRLVKFLSVVLPTHREYFSADPRLAALRKHSEGQLLELLQYMEELALLMDEMQYNKYILQDLTPEEKTLMSEMTASTAPNSTLNDTNTTLTSMEIIDDIIEDKENNVNESFRSRKYVREEHSVDTSTDYFSIRSSQNSTKSSSHRSQQQFEQIVAAVVVAGENDDEYSRHVAAAVLKSTQPEPTTIRPPPSDDDFSWDTSFSEFDPPSAGSSTHSNIDLLLSEEPPLKSTSFKGYPKLRQPPAAAPRRPRGDAHRQSTPFPESASASVMDEKKSDTSDNIPEQPPMKTKIEERWERAQRVQHQQDWEKHCKMEEYTPNHHKSRIRTDPYHDESSLTSTYATNKRLLQHFKGCVRCLLD